MPTIHKKLKLKNKKGISDIIGHQAEFEEVVLQPYENVDVITAGTTIPFASEFIQSNALKEDVYKRQSLSCIVGRRRRVAGSGNSAEDAPNCGRGWD